MENERPPSAVMPPNRRIFWWIKRRRVNGYGSQHVAPFSYQRASHTCHFLQLYPGVVDFIPHVASFNAI
jgi:hypothetical protein